MAAPGQLDELEHASRPREALPLGLRAALVEGGFSGAFLLAAALLAALGHGTIRWDVGVALVVAFAAALRAQFDIGAGYVPPTQLVFVPALFLEPARLAPLIALTGWMLGRLPDLARGDLHPSRLLKIPANCWFAVGPALVLVLAGGPGPSWGDWPLYAAALAAQFAGDLGSGTLREWLELGVPPQLQLRGLGYVWFIDIALSPIGLLAAIASGQHRFAFLAVLPLAALLVVFSTERTRRFETEMAAARSREAMIAGASHELQTPLSVLSGLVDALARSGELSPERREEAFASMRRQTGQLRHLVGQFIDYAGIKSGREPGLGARSAEVGPLLHGVAELWTTPVRVDAGDVRATFDPGRLHGVVMSLVSNAVKHGPPEGPVTVTARRAGRAGGSSSRRQTTGPRCPRTASRWSSRSCERIPGAPRAAASGCSWRAT